MPLSFAYHPLALRHVPRFAWLGYWPAGLMASLYRILSKARSGQSCSGKNANSGLRVWCRNMATAPIAPAELGEGEEPKHPAMTRVMEAFREKRS
jgi:hypothetical protein